MFKKKPKNCKKNCVRLIGPVLIALGVGVFFANIIPSYLVIIIFAIALICAGVWFITKC